MLSSIGLSIEQHYCNSYSMGQIWINYQKVAFCDNDNF